jgi:hypothetical protein
VILPDGTTHAGRTPEHWRRVALIVAKLIGHRVGVNTATRMAMDTGFYVTTASPRRRRARLRSVRGLARARVVSEGCRRAPLPLSGTV